MLDLLIHKVWCACNGIDSKTLGNKTKPQHTPIIQENKVVYTDKYRAIPMILDSPNAIKEQKQKANEFLGLMRKG